MEDTAAVVIPVYKSILDDLEVISIKQCVSVLGRYPVYLVMPDDLEAAPFEKLYKNFRIKRFAAKYFENVNAYSRLLLSIEFYKAFNGHEYILIHQTDAFVFEDQLMEWCDRGYDYIGAPWIGEHSWLKDATPAWAWRRSLVGNGGFSLRKISTFIKMLKLFRINKFFFLRENGGIQIHEDLFWSLYIPSLNPFFKVPDADTALKFSVETYPSQAFKINKGKLPFGCHAWMKYELDFWKPFIEQYGHAVRLK